MQKKIRLKQIISYFEQHMPLPQTELMHHNEYELTVAVILSAQCTDNRVNQITPAFFQRFPDFHTLAMARIDEIYELIKSCSYPNNKARHLSAMAKKIVIEYGGVLPKTQKELMTLPGIGRKSANVLLSILEHMPVLAVDTHVFRVAHRIGLVSKNARTPLAVEKQLIELIQNQQHIPKLHHWLILHGRYVCKARKPLCPECGIRNWCQFFHQKIKTISEYKK